MAVNAFAAGSVGRLIAVTSCKGGVGKSTVSLEIALRLASRGNRVGLFDADVHGPSLPTQLPSVLKDGAQVTLAADGWAVLPLEHKSLKLMSMGWLCRLWSRPADEVRSGHPPGRLAAMLLHSTAWGELDYLIVDSPPGTGEIPRALYSKVPLTGAIVVTTPSSLAISDVVRGVGMLDRFNVN